MSLQSKVLAAIGQAKTAIGDLVVQATVTKVTGTSYDPATLKPVQSISTATVDGFVGSWDEAEVRDLQTRTVLNVRADDVAFYVFPTDAEIDTDDKVALQGVNYIVVDLVRYSVGSKVGLTLLQLRR